MKIVCQREKLWQGFQIVSPVASSRSPKQILQRVKLDVASEAATLMATNLEVGIRYQAAGVEIESPGAVILPVDKFSAILRESSDESFQIESDGQTTSVRGQRSQFKLSAEDPHEFPNIAGFEEESFYEVPARLFRELIRRTSFATDNESSRYALGGVKFELEKDTLTAIGTDGRRLARMDGPIREVGQPNPLGDMTIVPTSALQVIERVVADDDSEVEIAVRQNEFLVRTPRTTVFARLLEGRFPRWRDVFPDREESVQLQLAVGPLHAAVRQAAIVTSDESRGVTFTFDNGTLVLSGHAADVGQSRVELPINYEGSELAVTLDPKFVIDYLRVLDPDSTFTMDLAGGGGAAVCRTDDGYSYVIMPLARDR